jgi:hypothetical protein
MKSAGERLYELYADSMIQSMDFEVDEWADLDPKERAAWDMAAKALLEQSRG